MVVHQSPWNFGRTRCLPLDKDSVSEGLPKARDDCTEDDEELYVINLDLVNMILDCSYNSPYIAVVSRQVEEAGSQAEEKESSSTRVHEVETSDSEPPLSDRRRSKRART